MFKLSATPCFCDLHNCKKRN